MCQVAFQFGFTTVFGWYATFVFLRTGHLAAAVVAHAFCNFMGFPDFSALSCHPVRGLVRAAFALGIGLFCALLGPLTSPALYCNSAPGEQPGSAYLQAARALAEMSA